ncbi:MAG: hypothetical protein HYU86_02905 [Chloroflexi bacterium]|nr:hypothetical protein [Chloroflexota bacterium]
MVDVRKPETDVADRLKKIPGYQPGMPAHRMDEVTFMDELELMWGRKWGAQSSIGELRTVLVHRPRQEGLRDEDLADPNFFVNFGRPGDIPKWDKRLKQHDDMVAALRSEGVEVIHTDYTPEKRKGIYASEAGGLGLEPIIIRGGAIIHRAAIASKRGAERWITEFLAKLGCPILFTVHGKAIHEVRGNILFLDPEHCIQATSVRSNMEGVRQVEPVLREAGVKEIHVAHSPSYLNSMHRFGAAMGFHIVNVLNMVDEKLAVCYPGALPYDTLAYLRRLGLRLIEIPEEEAVNQAGNTFCIRPGVTLMAAGNPVTTAALRREGVRVIEIDLSESAPFGSGPLCQIGPLVRDDGPYLNS